MRNKKILVAKTMTVMMTGMMLLGASSNVMAADDTVLDMSTEYPGLSVKAGESVDFGLDFNVQSGDGVDAKLSVEELPEGWEGYFKGKNSQISKVHVDNKGEDAGDDLATFHLAVPEDVSDGIYTVTLKADAGSGITDELELEVSVDETQTEEGNFTSEYPEQQGASGTSFSFDTTIVNNRGTEQNYSLSAETPEGWNVTFTPSGESSTVASMMVDAGASKGMKVAITPPDTIKQGEYTIPCTAVSANETLSTELKVIITGTYEVQVATPDGRLSLDAYANDDSTVTLNVTNSGNVDLTNLNLTASAPSNWEVTFDESAIDLLEAGATRAVTAHIKPDENAITGDYVTTIKVSNDIVTSSADFRISVKTRTTWGIAAVAVIIILLLILRAIFRKYGRR
ncbi:MAG: NEW3 domain-containing protein [Eubacteriales bacterium]|nr:NEW3 domain-containing protein [Eubacteriales bacterium]